MRDLGKQGGQQAVIMPKETTHHILLLYRRPSDIFYDGNVVNANGNCKDIRLYRKCAFGEIL